MQSRCSNLTIWHPAAKKAPLLVSEIFSIIKELQKTGITILLVEQNAKMALSIADTAAGIVKYMRKEDKRRSAYYHYYTDEEWRDVNGYDLSLDTSKYGIDGAVEIVKQMIPIILRK